MEVLKRLKVCSGVTPSWGHLRAGNSMSLTLKSVLGDLSLSCVLERA